MDIQGKIENFNVPEILQLIYAGKKSGTLAIKNNSRAALFFFRKGELTYAYTPVNRKRLGERLLSNRAVNNDALEKALDLQKQDAVYKGLGKILLENRLLEKAQLDRAVTDQANDLINRVIAWETGEFKFYDGRFPAPEEFKLSLKMEQLIDNGISLTEKLNRLRRQLPDFSSCMKMRQITGEEEFELRLSTIDWNILALCDGLRDIDALIHDSSYEPLVTLESIVRLLQDNLIEIISETENDCKPDQLERTLEFRLDKLTNLLNDFLNKG